MTVRPIHQRHVAPWEHRVIANPHGRRESCSDDLDRRVPAQPAARLRGWRSREHPSRGQRKRTITVSDGPPSAGIPRSSAPSFRPIAATTPHALLRLLSGHHPLIGRPRSRPPSRRASGRCPGLVTGGERHGATVPRRVSSLHAVFPSNGSRKSRTRAGRMTVTTGRIMSRPGQTVSPISGTPCPWDGGRRRRLSDLLKHSECMNWLG